MALDWTTVTMDLQRAVNNLALYVLESMTPMVWNPTFCPSAAVDVTQPPPGYKEVSNPSVVDDKLEPNINPIKDKIPGKKKKAPTDTR
jgi:hypothetical protein